jgi:pyruvate,water dikinase
MDVVRRFENVGLKDVDLVGGKGANLGELTAAGLPVPPGFVVTSEAYLQAVSESGARGRLTGLLGALNVDDPIALAETHKAARQLIISTPILAGITEAIENAYRRLGDDVAVAVRSSGTTEDAGDSSFAVMNASFTNVIGFSDVLARISDCWASLYGERVLAYRAEQHLSEEPAIAVIIQKMIFSEVSGVMFTADPTRSRHPPSAQPQHPLFRCFPAWLRPPDARRDGCAYWTRPTTRPSSKMAKCWSRR